MKLITLPLMLGILCGSLLSGALFAAETISTSCDPVMTPIMSNGDRTHIDVANRVAVAGFGYDDRGTTTPPATQVELASVGEVGTTWGTAYNPSTKKYYVASFLRRHADISPDGLGAIYEIDVSDMSSSATVGAPTEWINLNSIGHLGSGATLFPSQSAVNRNLSGPLDPSHDVWAFTRVGKQGIGGLELSDDYSTLYAMDLTNRQLLVIDTATKAVTARHAINDPGCAGGASDVRPFGVDYLNGEVYVGVTCSGETNSTDNDVNSYVMKLSGAGFTTVVSDVLQDSDLAWLIIPWTDDPYQGNGTCSDGWTSRSTPVITNIELDENNNMLIGVTSVHGWRYGWDNYPPDEACTDLDQFTTFGYVMKATPDGSGAWIREADPTDEDNGFFGWGINNADGHNRGFIGGLSVTDCSTQEVVVANIQDPISAVKGGTRYMRTADGQQEAATNSGDVDSATRANSSKRLYSSSDWGKSSGLGDIEYLRAAPVVPCSIIASATVGACTNVGTDADASNDTYTVTITASGTNASANFDYSSAPAGISGTGIAFTASPFTTPAIVIDSTASPLTLTVTDSVDSNCAAVITPVITEPVTCSPATPSGSLEISKVVTGQPTPFTSPNYDIVIDCSDNAFDQTVTLTAGTSQTISGIPENTTCIVTEPTQPAAPAGYSYGAASFTPASASTAPGVTITANTTISVAVTNPLTQNAVCSATPTVTTTCSDNSTPTDPSDDVFSYTINTTGSNIGASYSVSGDDTQAGLSYNADHTFGSYAINGGSNLNLTVTDVVDGLCTNSATATVPATCSGTVPEVDLELTKTVNPATAVSGDTIIYTLIARNTSGTNATGVVVNDLLPTGVTYVSDDGGAASSESGGTVTWTVGNLNAGSSDTLNISVTVN